MFRLSAGEVLQGFPTYPEAQALVARLVGEGVQASASGVLETIRTGGSVVLATARVPVARLVPLGPTTIEDAIASGMASPAKISVEELLQGVPQGPTTSLLSDLLGHMREDNRL